MKMKVTTITANEVTTVCSTSYHLENPGTVYNIKSKPIQGVTSDLQDFSKGRIIPYLSWGCKNDAELWPFHTIFQEATMLLLLDIS